MNAKNKKYVVIMAIILAVLMIGSMATMAISLIISSLSKKTVDDHEGHDHAFVPYENSFVVNTIDNDTAIDDYEIV
ncbi:MAG: hypothetical protein IKM33_03365 [Clostridia bacterium]|nr:hypothetical protein [Clostridia bacterium]